MYFYKKTKKIGFTLIELLITIFIITIILTIATISFSEIRKNARDNQRVKDIQQMQLVLEKYYQENNSYPNEIIFGESLADEEGEKIYLAKIPQNPNPRSDESCPESEYFYEINNNNYSIEFCLGKKTGEILAGYNCATPQGIRTGKCFQCESSIIYESYTYNVVQIGNQCWFKENLQTTKYSDGTDIPNITNATEWANTTSGAYAWYNNDFVTYGSDYGALYNWYAVSTTTNGNKNLCPTGWHVPTDTEWTTLTDWLLSDGGIMVGEEGVALKTNTWGGDNSSGFTALPAGYRFDGGNFFDFGNLGVFWSSFKYDTNLSRFCGLVSYVNSLECPNCDPNYGYSVRCLRN